LPDVVENIGNPGGALDLFPGGVLDAESDILPNGFTEEKRVLRNVSDCPPKCLEGHLFDRHTVNEQRPGGSFIESGY
jgi:hypothetical protein